MYDISIEIGGFMKKVLSVLLLIFAMLLSACGGVKYEYKDGVMYENKKPATGTFEFKSGDYKVKSQFVDGFPEGVLEKYYLDGKLMIKDVFEGGEIIQEEIYYKNGNLMGFSDAEGLKMYYDDGQLLMSTTYSTGETILYHENGNPMMEVLNDNVAIYNEDNEGLFKAESGAMVDLGLTMKKLEDGSFEVLKGDKLVSTIDANGEITNYLYSSGEKMLTLSDVDALTEFFFKDGTTLMKQYADGKILINYKSGKPLYEVEENNWYIYDEDGNKITSENETVTDIKKIN